MKLWVDDIRNAPDDSWHVARTVTEAVRILATMPVEEISLDHDISHYKPHFFDDLGNFDISDGRMEGVYVSCDETFEPVAWFIAAGFGGSTKCPKITLHTSNPSGASKMKAILDDASVTCEVKPMGKVVRKEAA